MARLIRTEKEVEGRYEDVWIVVDEDALDQWPAGPLTTVGQRVPRVDGLTRVRGQAPFTAAVNWGDGSSSAGSITGSSVAGTHTYAEEGSYTVSVTVTDARGLSGSGSATATISDAPLLAAGRNVTAERKESSPRLLATFKDADPAGKLGDYAATITWGDGTAAQPGAVASLDGVTFFVSGSHTYASKGTFTATVRIVEGGGYTTTVTSTVTVS